jgi:hypothetical protein
MPASSARWMMRMESASSLFPHGPNIIAPRHSGLTETPVRPSTLFFIAMTVKPPVCQSRCRQARQARQAR